VKITDKMIEDIKKCTLYNDDIEIDKKQLKELGYEVEEEKTALEEARELELITLDCDSKGLCNMSHEVQKKILLYEAAIEELQQKLKE
jgi:hypothetical protein